MTESGRIAAPFPEPPGPIARLLDELRLAVNPQDETEHEARRVATLHRPWDPASCPPKIRRSVYGWLDDVVEWINAQHTWRTERVIPICWDLHPHIVHELAVVACLRWEACFARTPTPLEAWQHYTLPRFLDRIADRIGEGGCPPGRHQPSPGLGRRAIYREAEAASGRRRRLSEDESCAGTR